jgi:hypothetical protein
LGIDNYANAAQFDKQMSRAKKQHWVPRFYLKEFCIPEESTTKNPKVWIVPREEGSTKLVGINDVAAQRYLYSPEDEVGQRCWHTEDKLAGLESIVSRIWPQLASDFVDLSNESVRKGLSLFVATLILRHPRKIHEYKRIQNEFIEYLDSGPKDAQGRPNIKSMEIGGKKFEVDNSDWHEFSNPTDYSFKKFFVEQIHNEAISIAKILMKKRWSMVFSEKPSFITTDNPVSILNLEKDIYGLSTKGTFLNFPVSPTRILMMDDLFDEPGSQYYSLSEKGPGPANLTSWIEARKFMVTGRDPEQVINEMLSLDDEKST